MTEDGNTRKKGRSGEREPPNENLKALRKIILSMQNNKNFEPFAAPVDVKGLEIPEYLQIIKHPMDLGTIQTKLENNDYNNDLDSALSDIALVWDNCYRFNPPGSEVSENAVVLQRLLALKMEKMPSLFTREHVNVTREPYPKKYNEEEDTPAPSVAPITSTSGAGRRRGGSGQSRSSGGGRERNRSAGGGGGSGGRDGGGSGRADYSSQAGQSLSSGRSIQGQRSREERERAFPSVAPNLDATLPPFQGEKTEPLSMEEKENIFQILSGLPQKFLDGVIEFIQQTTPHTGIEVDRDTLEFDLDHFEVRVQRHLQLYVNECQKVLDNDRQRKESELKDKEKEGEKGN